MGTAVSNPASFSSIRSACSAEGYGTSTNFTGYNRGGGIVPDHANTAGVSATDAGLRISQFSGITIPSPITHHVSTINSSTTSGACLRVGSGACTATTGPASTVSIVSGGSGSYTYSWAYVSGTTFTVNSPSSASTTFSKSGTASPDPGTNYSGVYRCTITDTGDSNYQTTQDVTITTNHIWE